jgi:CRP/FNR family transcriptional regulator, anaerobic regulatory protein
MPKAQAADRAVHHRETPCERCPLRSLKVFRKFSAEELKFVSKFKMGELRIEAGQTLLHEGQSSDRLFTVLEGWLYRHTALPDGRRQILNYSLPGSFIGVQAAVFKEMKHSVEALTDVVLCVFPRAKLWSLYESHSGLAFDTTWLVSREEKMLDDHLLSVGRRSAIERVAYLLMHLYQRAMDLGLAEKNAFLFPLNQLHLADTLGLSLVHTNKTLRKLYDRKLITWRDRTLTVLNATELARIARLEVEAERVRPLI